MAAYTKQFMHKGAGGAGATPRYGNFATYATSNVSQAINTLWASPFYLPASGTLSKIGMNIQGAGGAGNLCQFGIYQNAQDALLYPTQLIAGCITAQNNGTVTGFIETTLSPTVILDAGLYWAVFWNGAGTLATMVCNAITATDPILGYNAAQTAITGISVASTFAATMPTTFPAGGAYITTAVPLITLLIGE